MVAVSALSLLFGTLGGGDGALTLAVFPVSRSVRGVDGGQDGLQLPFDRQWQQLITSGMKKKRMVDLIWKNRGCDGCDDFDDAATYSTCAGNQLVVSAEWAVIRRSHGMRHSPMPVSVPTPVPEVQGGL